MVQLQKYEEKYEEKYKEKYEERCSLIGENEQKY